MYGANYNEHVHISSFFYVCNDDVDVLPHILGNAHVRNVHELYHHPELSHSVVIDEAVKLCKDFVDDTSHGLTNRVLQRVYDQITEERKTKAIAKKEETLKEETGKKRESQNQNIKEDKLI